MVSHVEIIIKYFDSNFVFFEQFAATDFARTITHDHLRSPTITHDLPRPLRPIVQSVHDLPTIPTFLGRSYILFITGFI